MPSAPQPYFLQRARRRFVALILVGELAAAVWVLMQIKAQKYGPEISTQLGAIVWATQGLIPLMILAVADRVKRQAPLSTIPRTAGTALGAFLILAQWAVLIAQPHIGIDIVWLVAATGFLLVPVTIVLCVFAWWMAGPLKVDASSQLIRDSTNGITIIFIHGILSGELGWLNLSTKASWPQIVRDDPALQGFGLYVFNYRADAMSGSYSIEEVSRKLTEEIEDKLPNELGFVFVGHSMGGIVARTYVVNRLVELHEKGKKIGCCLVASPSAGSFYANIIGRLSPFYNSQLRTLRSGQTNEWLTSIDRRFLDAIHDQRVKISGKELYEDNAPGWLRGLLQRAHIVPPVSAAKYFPQPLRIEYSDHGSIAKPADENAQQHTALRRFLRQF